MTTIDLSKASAKELKEALRLKKEAEKSERESRRIAYESIRDEVIKNLRQEVIHACGVVESLYAKVVKLNVYYHPKNKRQVKSTA